MKRGTFLACALLTAATAQPVAPRSDWRLQTSQLAASSGRASLQPLLSGKTATWYPNPDAKAAWFAFRLAAQARGPFLTVFSTSTRVKAVLEGTLGNSEGGPGEWVMLDSLRTGPFLNHFQGRVQPGGWVRLRFLEPVPVKVWNLGLYEPDSAERNDYWLALGASIQNQSMRQARFQPAVRRIHRRADPILFNLGVRGWSSGDLLANLPSILARHPYAGYALIHIGGNDISAGRPYPGGAETLERNLDSILTRIESAGIVPVLARVSYRRYRGEYPVPPESNGSEPYGLSIHDRFCQARTPDFYNPKTGHCAVDFYDWFRRHPEELSADGVHLNPRGEENWNRIWVERAAKRIYGVPVSIRKGGETRLHSAGGRIRFALDPALRGRPWRLSVWDVKGRLVREFGSAPKPEPPAWDLTDADGQSVSPGLYLFALTFPENRGQDRDQSGRILVSP